MLTSTRQSLGGCARLPLAWGLWCPVGVGVGGLRPMGSALLISGFVRWISILIPWEIGIGVAPRTRHMGVRKFPGTVLVVWRCKGSRVSWRLAVKFKIC